MTHARRSTRPRGAGLLVAAAVLAISAPAAGQRWGGPEARFEDRVEYPARVPGLSPAETSALQDAVRPVVELVRGNEAVRAPAEGACTFLYTSWRGYGGPPAGAEVYAGVVQWFTRQDRCGETDSGVTIHLNDLAPLFGIAELDGSSFAEDGEGPMYVMPRSLGAEGGHARYDGIVVVTRRTEPLVLPVSRERYLGARIAEMGETAEQVADMEMPFEAATFEEWQRVERPKIQAEHRAALASMAEHMSAAQLAEMRANLEASMAAIETAMRGLYEQRPALEATRDQGVRETHALVDELRAELASLSPAERASPACVSYATLDSGISALAECSDPTSRAVVSVNPSFFDRSLPDTALQVAIVTTNPQRGGTELPVAQRARMRIFETLDYDALQALLR